MSEMALLSGPRRSILDSQYLPRAFLVAFMLLFAAWFSAYSIRLHDAHLTHKADLGQIDQAIWNTSRGRFLEEIKGETISTRLTDHVEPIFLPVSLVFWLWDDVRALLILQAAALAAGAWPIYLLARRRLGRGLVPSANRPGQVATRDMQYAPVGSLPATAEWGGFIFGLAYLLTPALQAAAIAEFHALPLAAPLIAWALWAVEDRRWWEFVVAATLLAAVQEGMALLTAALGLYAVVKAAAHRGVAAASVGHAADGATTDENGRADAIRPYESGIFRADVTCGAGRTGGNENLRSNGFSRSLQPRATKVATTKGPIFRAVAPGLAMVILGCVWFYVATFVIIPHHASEAYGLTQTPYAARFGALGDSFGGVLKSFVTQPAVVFGIVSEPLRLRYLASLLWPTAFLALLGPEIAALSLPLLLANLLSAFPFQYSGELHYSAPLVPFFVAAGILGLERLIARSVLLSQGLMWRGRRLRGEGFVLAAVLLCAVGFNTAAGYLPWSGEFRRSGWPQVTAHHRLLERFAAQVPPHAPLSVATDLYPHFSHRQYIYQFPLLGQAAWALVDVTGTTDRHPNDVRAAIFALLDQGWGVVDAADGYLLLGRGQGRAVIPDAFYDFVRASNGRPHHQLDVAVGDRLQLLGYDVVDDRKWRRTSLRFYWRVLAPLPDDTAITLQVLAPDGSVADDSALRSSPALLWYPPTRWAAGETLVTQTLPWYLPRDWAPALSVSRGPVLIHAWVGRPWTRRGGALVPLEAPGRVFPLAARFADAGWSVHLTGWTAAVAMGPGRPFPVVLRWQAFGPAARDLTVFLHLRDETGRTVAHGDGTPTWFVLQPTTTWPSSGVIWDAHTLVAPPSLPEGLYSLVAGWYDWRTGERLRAYDADGNSLGDEFVLGPVMVSHRAGPRADLACLLVVESCASLE